MSTTKFEVMKIKLQVIALSVILCILIGFNKVKGQDDDTIGSVPEMPAYSIPQGQDVIPGINDDGFCNVVVGTDYTDPDLYINDGKQTIVSHEQQCCLLCQQVTGCMSWVYSNEDDNVLDRKKGECWLSSGYTNGVRCSLCSSVTFEKFNDTLSNVLENILFKSEYGILNDKSKTIVDSTEQCYDLCDKTELCIAWSYIKETDETAGIFKGECILSGFVPNYEISKNANSGHSLAMKIQMCQPLENTCLSSFYGYLNDPKYSITQSDEECAYLCQKVYECRSWVRIKKKTDKYEVGECILRDWVPMQEPCDYANAGIDGGFGETENVILIIADDLGIDHLSMYADIVGNEKREVYPHTPNLNFLASKGIVFENVYSNPTCSPTRTAMMSGRYGFRTGVGYPISPLCPNGLNLDEDTIPKLLPDYVNTACIGKWHMASYEADVDIPRVMGFDRFEGFIDGSVEDYYNWDKTVNGETVEASYNYCTTDMVDAVRRFFEDVEDSKWFLWMAFNAPHTPFHIPPAGLHYHTDLVNDSAIIEEDPVPYFHAMIEALDTEIGRIWDYIPESHQERTTIIFMGDNGSPTEVSDGHPFDEDHGKGTLTEGGVRVPFVVAGANVRDYGRVIKDLVNTVDLFSTILELMTVKIDPELGFDSKSIVPIMHNEEYEKRRWVYSEAFGPNSSCNFAGGPPEFQIDYGQILREERFKLHYPFIYNPDPAVKGEDIGIPMMFDVLDDPWEKNNLLDDNGDIRTDLEPDYAEIVRDRKNDLDGIFDFINAEKVIDERSLESFSAAFEEEEDEGDIGIF